eukprot:GILJ01007125.1.p1 GENE.GILJ01007125.1~~GILJ01007125.1.p1  ORF type:complete len:116 (-),score=4.91 GILJ01007125.1:124-432(-)
MVCTKCEKKLAKLVVPDKWKDGARNTTGGRDEGRKVGGNMLLAKKQRYQPYAVSVESRCKKCSAKLHQQGSSYCQTCAYKKGVCAMCGVKVLDTSMYKQSSV